MSNYNLIINRLSIKYRIPNKVVKKLVESQFEFISNKIKDLDFSNLENEEDLNVLKTTFNVKYLFNMYPKYKVIEHINKRRK